MLSLLFIEGVEELFQLALVAFGEGVVFLEHGSGVFVERNGTAVDRNVGASGDVVPVSYTHLTLPTILRV